jgi:hypothetical protein
MVVQVHFRENIHQDFVVQKKSQTITFKKLTQLNIFHVARLNFI